MTFKWGDPIPNWHYAEQLKFSKDFEPYVYSYQRVRHNIFVYIKPYAGKYHAQLYFKAFRGVCQMEAWSRDPLKELFPLAEQWLRKYADLNFPENLNLMKNSKYEIGNTKGVWGRFDDRRGYFDGFEEE